MKLMITNGGSHPPDKWADVTTESILDLIEIAEDSDTPQAAAARQAKRELRPVLFAIFNQHHDKVQQHERGELKAVKKHTEADLLATGKINPHEHMGVMDEVAAALAATPFAAHFAQPVVLGVIKQIVGQHTANAMHIERAWHRDRLQAAKGA